MSVHGDEVVEALLGRARGGWESQLSSEVTEALIQRVVDTIGCAAAGRANDSSRAAVTWAQEQRGRHPVWFSGECSSQVGAAFANGVMARCLDLNDTYFSTQGGGHPSDYIPALLAIGEAADSSGDEMLRALCVLYDAFCSFVDAWKPTTTGLDYVAAGSIAVALAGGLLAGLDDERLRSAVSLSVVGHVALGQTRIGEVSMWKNCASAWAACGGLRALALARAGIDGPPRPFTGAKGFLAVAAPEFDASGLRHEQEHAVLRTDLKSHAAGFVSQSAIEAAIELRQRIPRNAQIVSIHVAAPSLAVAIMAGDREKWQPRTRETADHSIPFVVAAGLLLGEVGELAFDPATLGSPAMATLLDITTVRADDECSRMWPEHLRTVVSVVLDTGEEVRAEAVDFPGHHATPFSRLQLMAKFRRNCEPVLGSSVDDVIALLRSLPELDDLRIVGQALGGLRR